MTEIKVLLAEDHTIVRKGLASLLLDQEGIEVIGEACDGWEAVLAVEKLQPDVVVMDITMPRLSGLEATRRIKRDFPSTQVVILTVHTIEEYVPTIFEAGASGYVVKEAALNELILAIRAAHSGHWFLSPQISRNIILGYIENESSLEFEERYDKLTSREREVLQLLVEGHSTREVAELLVVSIKTAESHRTNLMRKLDIHNLADLTRYAIRKGILPLK